MYIEQFKKFGEIANCAGEGKCGYTTRPELGYAYARMHTSSSHNGPYNLHGERLTQSELAEYLSDAFAVELRYRAMSVEAYAAERTKELGPFMGSIIAGIYQGIRRGALDRESDYEAAAGRPHESWDHYFANLREQR